MSIWNLKIQDSEAAPEMSEIEKADRNSARPFAVEYLGGVVTYRGIARNQPKPNGRFRCLDEYAVDKLAQRLRKDRAEQFKLIVEAEDAFNQTFSKDPCPESVPVSGVRAINKELSEPAMTLRGVGK